MITYQKVYTDHVRSSTLMSQFTVLWRNQLMCDAEIITGSTVTKAHRLVLVASCGIWHSYEETKPGSILEVVLPSNICSASVNTFLEYLYEGHMILSEDNVQEIEKLARLLNVDAVLSCCHDFQRVVKLENELKQTDFQFKDLKTVNHIKSTTLIKTVSKDIFLGTDSDKFLNKYLSETFDSSSDKHTRRSSTASSDRQHSRSSLSFTSSTPTDVQRHRLNLQAENQNSTNTCNSSHYPSHSSHSIIDFSHDTGINNKSPQSSTDSVPYQGQLSDSNRIKSVRSSIDSASSQRLESQHNESLSSENAPSMSPQNQSMTCMPSSSPSNGIVKQSESPIRQHASTCRPSSSDSYPGSVTKKGPTESYSRSISAENLDHCQRKTPSSAEHAGFPLPGIPANLWDKTLLQYNASQEYFKAYYDSAFGALYAKANESQPDEHTVDLSGDPQEVEEGRARFEAGQIDLSAVKIESCDEPLDLHVEGLESTSMNRQTDKDVPNSAASLLNHSLPLATSQSNRNYQPTSGQYSPLPTAKKKPVMMSTHFQKMMQSLQLNRRALASPASLNSLAVGNHRPVRMPGKNNYKVCSLCYSNKIRTKSGYYVYSYYKCSVCDVPLCIGRRKCFLEYHRGSMSELQSTEPVHGHD